MNQNRSLPQLQRHLRLKWQAGEVRQIDRRQTGPEILSRRNRKVTIERCAAAILTCADGMIVVPPDNSRRVSADPGDDFRRRRPVVDEIAKDPDAIPLVASVKHLGFDRLQRVDVRMDIGEYEDSHRLRISRRSPETSSSN
jgi:hypothetical protein